MRATTRSPAASASLRLAASVGAAMLAGLAVSCAPPVPPPAGMGALSAHTETMQAQVVGVDRGKRIVTLRGPGGQNVAVVAGPEVQNLDQVRTGDLVDVAYTEGLAIRVRGGEIPLPGVVVSGQLSRAAPGQPPAAAWDGQATRTVQVLAVDPAAHTITYRDVDGAVYAIVVRDPANWPVAERLTPGTLVDVTNFQTVAVSLVRI